MSEMTGAAAQTNSTGKKKALYELVQIPEPFEPVHLVLGQDRVRAFADAVDDHGDWYLGRSSPFGKPICHPLILANELLFLFYQSYDGNTAKGLHTHEQLTFVAPAHVGERVTISGGYVERYEKRGLGYVVMEAVATAEDGRELVRHRGVEVMRATAGAVVGRGTASQPGRRVKAQFDTGAPLIETVGYDAPSGAVLRPLSKAVTQEQMFHFSWGDRGYRNVHTSIEVAREQGLDRTLVQAQQQTAFITELMVRAFGASWFVSGHLDLRFVAPLFCSDPIEVHGVLLDDGNKPGERELEVWVQRNDGVRTAIGWARATPGAVSAPGAPRPT